MSNKISTQRKAIYYVGIGMLVLGFILFISVFFAVFGGMESNFFLNTSSLVTRPIVGMICMIIGSIMMNVGSKGIAGSGVILDPEKAREDLKPFNSAKGEMINDVIENIDVVKNISNQQKEVKEVVKIKCRYCGELNDEDAKFCKSCGKSI